VAENVVIRTIRSDETALLRDVRLRALVDSPDAFGSTYEVEARFPMPGQASSIELEMVRPPA
jgi:hypothetical protein